MVALLLMAAIVLCWGRFWVERVKIKESCGAAEERELNGLRGGLRSY
jgi:hypothetical protein